MHGTVLIEEEEEEEKEEEEEEEEEEKCLFDKSNQTNQINDTEIEKMGCCRC